MNKKIAVCISASATLLIIGCTESPNTGTPNIESAAPKVPPLEKTIMLKDLAIGKPIKSIKGAKEYSSKMYMFDYEYFGEKRTFNVSTNDAGLITKYQTRFSSGSESLKSAIEEKLSTENGRPVKFSCDGSKFSPDSSADMEIKTCKIDSLNEVLTITETRMQPTAKYAGLPQLPSVVTSIELVGTVLNSEAEAAKKKADEIKAKAAEAKRKSDV